MCRGSSLQEKATSQKRSARTVQDADQSAVLRLLADPRTYGGRVDAVDRIDTHGAIVFLAGDRAYKVKRAVAFPYLDFSTLEKRQQFCLRELEINRRTAPDLYLAVVPVQRHSPRDNRPLHPGEPPRGKAGE